MTAYVGAWVRAFVFTRIIEVPIYMQGVPGPRWKAALIGFGASALTHPVVWFGFPRWGHPCWRMVFVAEVFAVVVETV